VRFALQGLKQIYRADCIYKKAGIIVSEIVPESQQQLSLFDNTDRKKQQKIMRSIDQINSKMGKDKVRLAVQGYQRNWRLKQERLSPCYSTRIKDALSIKL
jgi:DNA polymerase V